MSSELSSVDDRNAGPDRAPAMPTDSPTLREPDELTEMLSYVRTRVVERQDRPSSARSEKGSRPGSAHHLTCEWAVPSMSARIRCIQLT